MSDPPAQLTSVVDRVDYAFGENGLTAYKLGKELKSNSFIQYVGEEEYKKLANWILRYLSELDIPIKRSVLSPCWAPPPELITSGTFIEFRRGMVNVSPIGRNASTEERNDFEKYDLVRVPLKLSRRDADVARPTGSERP